MTETKNAILEKLTVTHDDRRLVSFCCDMVLYTDKDLSSVTEAVLYIYEKFLATCPPGDLRWYATENMTKHKACTPRALDMLRGWLKPGAPARKVINIHIKDGSSWDDASEYSFWVYGEESGATTYGAYANVIRCAFPGRWAINSPTELLDFVVDASKHFPFQSGHAGFVLETNRYSPAKSDTAAWHLSMQHPGLDISNPITDSLAIQRDAIKGVNWLTILSTQYADLLGGDASLRQKLPQSVGMVSVSGGVIIQAGLIPLLGHVNHRDLLLEYRAVYEVVASLQKPILARYGALTLPGGDHRDKTKAWLRRFA